ncbi:MAG: hotdog fold domain-containing protein, partial [Deltaproteobacteria bacterium]
ELGYGTVTASLEVRFKHPAPILERLHVFGEITEITPRLVKARARVVDEKGTILAAGTSTLMRHRGPHSR